MRLVTDWHTRNGNTTFGGLLFRRKKAPSKEGINWADVLKIASTYGDRETPQEKEAWRSLGSSWMQSGITDHVWSLEEIVALLD